MNNKPLKIDATHRPIKACARLISDGFRVKVEGDRLFLIRDAECDIHRSPHLIGDQGRGEIVDSSRVPGRLR